MKKLIKVALTTPIVLVVVTLIVILLYSGIADAQTGPVTKHYGTVSIDGNTHLLPDHWDLTAAPVTISYELDLSKAPNNACCQDIEHWSSAEVGLVNIGPDNELTGVWMSGFLADHDNPDELFPDFPDNEGSLDLDDKFNMIRGPELGSSDERHYDVDCSNKSTVGEVGLPTASSNYGIWFDRDGVDQWQAAMWGAVDGGTYNTEGKYQVQIEYQAANDSTKGTACAKLFPNELNPLDQSDPNDDIFGVPTGFNRQNDDSYQYFPYGISFDAENLSNMQVFVRGDVHTHPQSKIMVRKLTVTGYLAE